jgi:tetratricopeptide (TPR) repeat protein
MQEYNQDGIQLFQQGQYAAAREDFQAALALQPEDPALFYNLGECYDRLGDVLRAERSYGECLQRAPNHVECRHAMACMLMRTGRRDEAIRFVQSWLARGPNLAAAYAEDGWLWHQLGDLPKAQARLQQALDLDPHEARALIELARVYEGMQRPDRALVLYERALNRNPQQFEVVKRVNQLRSQGVRDPLPD